jgi:toxin ParE1/3/4
MSSLYDFPDRGAKRSEFGDGVRILIEGNYVIIYRKVRNHVEILRVVHGAMDLEKLDLA